MEGCKSGLCQCPLSGAEAQSWSLLGGSFFIKCMLKSIGALVLVRSREVVHFSECLLGEVPLYSILRCPTTPKYR